MAKARAALGLKVRIGRAVVVAVAGPIDAPEVIAKQEIQVAFTFEEGAVFHAAEELTIEEARKRIREPETRFTARARKELGALAKKVDAKIVAAALAAPPTKTPPPLESILRSHALVHAAEVELYRRVFTEACVTIGVSPTRIVPESVPKALGLTPATVTRRLATMGKAAGRPWTVHQKEAALAAWFALASRE